MKKKSIAESSAGIIIPALIFLFLIPKLINDFGIERFGYISLFWITLGAASIFDMGLSRGLTYFVAKNNIRNHSSLDKIWQVFYLSIIWGILFSSVFFYFSNMYFEASQNTPQNLQLELKESALFIALTIPFVICHAVLKGVLEGLEDFFFVSTIKILTAGLMAFLLFFNQYFESTLNFVAITLFISRLVGLFLIVNIVIRRIKPIFNPSTLK